MIKQILSSDLCEDDNFYFSGMINDVSCFWVIIISINRLRSPNIHFHQLLEKRPADFFGIRFPQKRFQRRTKHWTKEICLENIRFKSETSVGRFVGRTSDHPQKGSIFHLNRLQKLSVLDESRAPSRNWSCINLWAPCLVPCLAHL